MARKPVGACPLAMIMENPATCHSERSQPTGCPKFAATRRQNRFTEFKGLTRRVTAEEPEATKNLCICLTREMPGFFAPLCSTQNDTVNKAFQQPRDSKYYEQTQHLIENKEGHFREPSNLLKISFLAEITQQVFDDRQLSCKVSGRSKMDKLVHKGTSPATALASRENGCKSKGPITEQGKAMVRANAGEHWVCPPRPSLVFIGTRLCI